MTYEKKHEFNIGIDLGFLNNRINVQFDWYKRNNYDLIGPRVLNDTTGTLRDYANVASMRSHGEELSISTKNILTKDFQWSTDFIFAHVKTKVTDLETHTRVISMISNSGFTILRISLSFTFLYGFQGAEREWCPHLYQHEW